MCGTIVYYDKSLPCLCMCREKGPVSPEFAATLRKGRGLINTNAKRYLKRSFGDQTFRIANIRAAFNMPRADWETFENTAWLKKVGPDAYRLA